MKITSAITYKWWDSKYWFLLFLHPKSRKKNLRKGSPLACFHSSAPARLREGKALRPAPAAVPLPGLRNGGVGCPMASPQDWPDSQLRLLSSQGKSFWPTPAAVPTLSLRGPTLPRSWVGVLCLIGSPYIVHFDPSTRPGSADNHIATTQTYLT